MSDTEEGLGLKSHPKHYNGHTTRYVIMACTVAAAGGALFGFDNGT